MEQVTIFDTTLRDGEQAAGGSLNIQEKLEIARQLEKQVRELEAGDLCHIIVEGPGRGMDFFAEAAKPIVKQK